MLCMAEPEEHLTMQGAGLSLPSVNRTPTHLQSWDARGPAMVPRLPGGYNHLHYGGLVVSPHRYQKPLPSAAFPPPTQGCSHAEAPSPLRCLQDTYFPAVSL